MMKTLHSNCPDCKCFVHILLCSNSEKLRILNVDEWEASEETYTNAAETFFDWLRGNIPSGQFDELKRLFKEHN